MYKIQYDYMLNIVFWDPLHVKNISSLYTWFSSEDYLKFGHAFSFHYNA